MPAIAITGMNNQREVSAGNTGASTTALAPNAPMMNCPSAPIFHNFMRNAIEQASAVRMIGVAFTIVSDNTPTSPNDARRDVCIRCKRIAADKCNHDAA